MLGPFTNKWDMVNDDGELLQIGVLSFHNTKTSTFCVCVKPQDVKAALAMLSYLYLKHCTVKEKDSFLFDSSMLLIKQSSEEPGIHFNSTEKQNCMFDWFIIDFLSMLILFDSFIGHRLLFAPAPYKKVPLNDEEQGMLVHNKKILIKFCMNQGASRVEKYLKNKKTCDIG